MTLGTVYTRDELHPLPGTEPVPGFRLRRRLGEGGHGEVWLADGPGGFAVALKFLRDDGPTARGEIDGDPLDILRTVRHPHLLVTFGAWPLPGGLVLGMELAEGTLWDRFCEAVDQGLTGIPRDELWGYLDQTASAIDFLNAPRHTVGSRVRMAIQHCDLKPQNLLLVGGAVKVGDFGVARLLDRSLAGHPGDRMTLAYAAPEFFRRETSSHSDQYSLAATYCYLRGGRVPFDGPAAAMMAGHMLLDPDLGMLPACERPAVARALAKEPDARWSSCSEFVAALRASAAVEPLARPTVLPPPPPSDFDLLPEPAERTTARIQPLPPPRLVPRRRRLTAARRAGLAVASLALVAGLSYAVWAAVGFEREPAPFDDVRVWEAARPVPRPSLPLPPERPHEEVEPAEAPEEVLEARSTTPREREVTLDPTLSPPVASARPDPRAEDAIAGMKFVRSRVQRSFRQVAAAVRRPGEKSPIAATDDQPAVKVASPPATDVAKVSDSNAMTTIPPPPKPGLEPPKPTLEPPSAVRVAAGKPSPVELRLRREGWPGPVRVHFEGLPRGVTVGEARIAADSDRAEASATVAADVPGGSHVVRAVGEAGGETIQSSFVLRVDPPPSAAGLIRRGREAWRQGHYEEAVAALDEALRLAPEDASAHALRGSAHLRLRRFERAVGDFDRTIELSPNDATAINNRALARRSLGDVHRAIADYDEAIRLRPGDAVFHFNRGLAYQTLGDDVGAVADFSEAVRINPSYARAFEARAVSHARKGDAAKAKADTEQARRLLEKASPAPPADSPRSVRR